MQNFTYHNPVTLVFGKGTIDRLADLVPTDVTVLLLYGGGSIRANGVYDQVRTALDNRPVVEFGGIEANPHYETCMRAVAEVRRAKVGFILAVGGGSVLDAAKFIAAAACYTATDDPWDFMGNAQPIDAALPLGAVLTLPATGSEMNENSVISRVGTQQKLHFGSPHVYPKFSILDPETTFTLPPRQTANGVVDAFVHVMEQYMTYPCDAPLQDRQAEAVLLTLVEEGPKALVAPRDYKVRANLMWCATQALNGLIACGVPQDWASHMIGHELTALYGIDHAQSLAVVLPSLLRHEMARKRTKLAQFGTRVWGVTEGSEDVRAAAAIDRMEAFFHALGVGTRLSDYGIPADAARIVAKRLDARGMRLGEHGDQGPDAVAAILAAAR
jgi:NADP-dependent alcohol dehydrogenase